MTEQHLILPFEGVDDVRFGMTPEQVAEVAGPPDGVEHDDYTDVTLERRGATEFEYDDESGVLQSVCVFKPGRGKAIREQLDGARYVPAFWDGIEVLDSDGFATLFERERTVEGIGNVGVLFPDLGFLVVGFRKRVPEGRYVIVFARDMLTSYEEGWLNV